MGNKKAVVVTGVSSGIGFAAAKSLVDEGIHVFGSVRKEEDGARASKELGDQFTPLLFDVTDAKAIHAASKQVAEYLDGQTLLGLVNNAGIAIPGPIIHQPIEQFQAHLDVNIVGVVNAVQAFAGLLGADIERVGNPGRIINIGSTGGRNAFPFMSAYHTTKFGLEGLTESMRRELMIFGIDAILVAPGSVATAIWDKADNTDYSIYDETAYGPSIKKLAKATIELGKRGLPAEVIGDAILTALTTPKPKTYYRITQNPKKFAFLNLLPARFIDRYIAKSLELLPPEK